jgi:hypothetical protein
LFTANLCRMSCASSKRLLAINQRGDSGISLQNTYEIANVHEIEILTQSMIVKWEKPISHRLFTNIHWGWEGKLFQYLRRWISLRVRTWQRFIESSRFFLKILF